MLYRNYIKRIIDFILALLGIVILSPVFLILSILIKYNSKGPILFKQIRVGRGNKTFKILKFRTMKIETPKDMPTHLLENPESYITSVGKFMRKTSLDELPQLWNIIVGEMSVIGPRPSLPSQTDLNRLRDQSGASKIRPGLTGLAQVSGRDELPIDIKASYDGQYVEKVTFTNDFKLFFQTVASVLKSDGIKEGKINEKNNDNR